MFRKKFFCSLALDESLFLHIEVYIVLMIDALTMKLNGEIILTRKRHDLAFCKDNFQCVLVHIFVQEWT